MDKIITILEELGLDEVEIQVYLLCLKYGQLKVSTVARMIGMPRSTIHGYVEKLHKKAFLVSHAEVKWFSYSAIWVEQIIWLLKEKKNQLNHHIKVLKSNTELFDINFFNTQNLPQIKYYEGIESLNLIYSKYHAAKNNYSFFDIDAAVEYMWQDLDYFCKIAKQHTWVTKEILKKSKIAQTYAKMVSSEKHQIKFISLDDKQSFFSDNMLFDGRYYHISYTENIMAIEINNPVFYETQKILFEQLRERL